MQLYYTIILIFVLLFICQIVLGTFSLSYKAKLPQKYSFILGDLSEPVSTLEKYMKIYRKVNLKVNAAIKEPAKAQNEFLLLNKNAMYTPNLYVNFFIIFQLELTKVTNRFAREARKYQIIIFTLQIILFFVAIALGDSIYGQVIASISLALLIIGIVLSMFIMILLQYISEESIEIAKDLLNLDNVEIARTESLANDIKYRVFEYPFDSFRLLIQFLLP